MFHGSRRHCRYRIEKENEWDQKSTADIARGTKLGRIFSIFFFFSKADSTSKKKKRQQVVGNQELVGSWFHISPRILAESSSPACPRGDIKRQKTYIRFSGDLPIITAPRSPKAEKHAAGPGTTEIYVQAGQGFIERACGAAPTRFLAHLLRLISQSNKWSAKARAQQMGAKTPNNKPLLNYNHKSEVALSLSSTCQANHAALHKDVLHDQQHLFFFFFLPCFRRLSCLLTSTTIRPIIRQQRLRSNKCGSLRIMHTSRFFRHTSASSVPVDSSFFII